MTDRWDEDWSEYHDPVEDVHHAANENDAHTFTQTNVVDYMRSLPQIAFLNDAELIEYLAKDRLIIHDLILLALQAQQLNIERFGTDSDHDDSTAPDNDHSEFPPHSLLPEWVVPGTKVVSKSDQKEDVFSVLSKPNDDVALLLNVQTSEVHIFNEAALKSHNMKEYEIPSCNLCLMPLNRDEENGKLKHEALYLLPCCNSTVHQECVKRAHQSRFCRGACGKCFANFSPDVIRDVIKGHKISQIENGRKERDVAAMISSIKLTNINSLDINYRVPQETFIEKEHVQELTSCLQRLEEAQASAANVGITEAPSTRQLKTPSSVCNLSVDRLLDSSGHNREETASKKMSVHEDDDGSAFAAKTNSRAQHYQQFQQPQQANSQQEQQGNLPNMNTQNTTVQNMNAQNVNAQQQEEQQKQQQTNAQSINAQKNNIQISNAECLQSCPKFKINEESLPLQPNNIDLLNESIFDDWKHTYTPKLVYGRKIGLDSKWVCYASLTAAARALGLDVKLIWSILRGKEVTINGGYEFTYETSSSCMSVNCGKDKKSPKTSKDFVGSTSLSMEATAGAIPQKQAARRI